MANKFIYTDIFNKYFSEFKSSYFIIGGNSCAYNLSLFNIEFRKTKDFDIVLVSSFLNVDFYKRLVSFIKEGGYENSYINERKTCYRFINPKNIKYPPVLEFFCEDGAYLSSLDKHLAKLIINKNESDLSAIVLSKEVYKFAFNNIDILYNLPFLSLMGCVVLKIYAYYQNVILFKKHLIKNNESKKHLNDVINILISTPINSIKRVIGLGGILKENVETFIKDIESNMFEKQLKSKNINKNDLIEVIGKIL